MTGKQIWRLPRHILHAYQAQSVHLSAQHELCRSWDLSAVFLSLMNTLEPKLKVEHVARCGLQVLMLLTEMAPTKKEWGFSVESNQITKRGFFKFFFDSHWLFGWYETGKKSPSVFFTVIYLYLQHMQHCFLLNSNQIPLHCFAKVRLMLAHFV